MSGETPKGDNKNKEADERLREIRLGIEARYEMKFLETGADKTAHIFRLNRRRRTAPGRWRER
jgi:hypothetical protein